METLGKRAQVVARRDGAKAGRRATAPCQRSRSRGGGAGAWNDEPEEIRKVWMITVGRVLDGAAAFERRPRADGSRAVPAPLGILVDLGRHGAHSQAD